MSKQDKPVGAKLGWRVLETTYPFADEWRKLRQDRVHIEGEGEQTFTYTEHAGAVAVVPVTRDGRIVLMRQYRYAVDDWCLEVPAGGMHDTGDASLEEVARKELSEELGATCDSLHYVTFIYTSPAFGDEKCHIFLALGVELTHETQPESTEVIHIEPVPVREALKMARTGQIRNSASGMALLLCEDLIREHGYA